MGTGAVGKSIKSLIIIAATPLLILSHELVHMLAFAAIGIDAKLENLYLSGPALFAYTVEGMKKAGEHYGIPKMLMSIPALGAPVFSLIVAVAFIVLWRKNKKDQLIYMALPPVILKSASMIVFAPKYIFATMKVADEAIGSYFLGIDQRFAWGTLLFCNLMILAYVISVTESKIKLLYWTTLSIAAGFFGIGMLINATFFNNITF